MRRPFLSKCCNWHRPCLAPWIKEIKSMHAPELVAKEWDPGSSDPAALLAPVTLEQVMSWVPQPLRKELVWLNCSSPVDLFELCDCALASSQPKQPLLMFPLSYSSAKPSPATQLVLHKKLEGGTAGPADSHWAQGYSIPRGTMLST